MRNATRSILRPKTSEEAGALLAKGNEDVGVLWFGPRVDAPDAWARTSMLDLSHLDLAYVQRRDDVLAIGSMTPLEQLVEGDATRSSFGGLIHTAARRLAHYGMRNLATVGGTLMTPSGPPELALALLAIGCEAVFLTPEERVLPVEGLLAEPDSAPRGLLMELRLPIPQVGKHGWDLAWLARSPMDQALAAAAVGLSLGAGRLTSSRIAVASVGLSPRRIGAAESALEGSTPEEVMMEDLAGMVEQGVEPRQEFRASAEYQRRMMGRLAVRAATAALSKVGEG